jgi:hypothetical protein
MKLRLKKNHHVSLRFHLIVNFVVFILALLYIVFLLVVPCNERTILLLGSCNFARVAAPIVVFSWFVAFALVSTIVRHLFLKKDTLELYKVIIIYVVSFLLGQNTVFLISPFLYFLTDQIGRLIY